MAHTCQELGVMLWRTVGARAENGQQAGTVALGSWQQQLFVAMQQGTVREFDELKNRLYEECERIEKPVTTIANAREITNRGMRVSEWTGKHAEMMVLYAMRKVIPGARLQDACIAANAQLCYFCANMLTRLGAKGGGLTVQGLQLARGPRSLTGWWNPVNDTVYGNGSPEWTQELPGGP